jgi:hypothetical protein
MIIQTLSRAEKQALVESAARCLSCDAPECHEFTPEGVDVCADLPFVNGKPIPRETLVQWKHELEVQSNGRAG